MKTKLTLVAVGLGLAAVIALHVGHTPPKDGVCPLGKAIHGR